MTQDSWPWNCSPTNGDYGALTVNDFVNAQQFGSNTQPNSDGVVYWTSTSPLPGGTVAVDGLLEPSLAGSVVTIATGVGMVQGWNYINTADVDFDFAAAPGNANATDLIVLERGDPTSTLSVRLARVQGAASTVATVTQSEALWQVAIARVALNGSGLPTGVTDVRRFVNQDISWRQGGDATDWQTQGTTNYLVGNVKQVVGVSRVTIPSGNDIGSVVVTLPPVFSQIPHVLASIGDTNTALAVAGITMGRVTPTSTTSVTIQISCIGSAGPYSVDVCWIATGVS